MISSPIAQATAIIVAYVAGSIPSAYLAGQSRGVDLRKHGSGNLGATNVVRVLGARIGAMVFLADFLKGFLPVLLLPRIVASAHGELFALALGVAAIIGHVRPVFLRWQKGGKGVATAAGVFMALAWVPTLIALVVWLAVFAAFRYVSLASLVAALVLPVALLLTGAAYTDTLAIAAFVVALFVFVTHRGNIARLRRGEEHRFVKSRVPTETVASPRRAS